MRLYSTNNPYSYVSLEDAVFKGLPDDNGLFMPESINPINKDFLENIRDYSFKEIGFEVSCHLLGGSIPEDNLWDIINKSITFPAPLIKLDTDTYILELFHGPSLAFKDFGARFMAQLMSYFNQGSDQELVILVATSGDTGGAVAAGFYKTSGIKVVILYPAGKVSPLQEKQLTTMGQNIIAIEVDGTFDDCQLLVKKAFLDKELTSQLRLSSANSINIARLIPQTFYYFEAYKQLPENSNSVTFCVPSGNLGNLTAGLFAKKMGLPINHFVAATNANDSLSTYLKSGVFNPRPSISTLSNAMDVGNPSNFARILDLYCSTWNNIREDVKTYSFNDKKTEEVMRRVRQKHNYILDPHGAVGLLAWETYLAENPNSTGIILETAHPAKFLESVESINKAKIEVPERLAVLSQRVKNSIRMGIDYAPFKEWLQATF